MSEFHLQIVTMDGIFFDGHAERIIVRTIEGDVGILKNHVNYIAPIGIGKAEVTINGISRSAACVGGLVSVTKDVTRIIATTFEWADEIDLERAKHAKERAEKILQSEVADKEINKAEIRLKRALNRIRIYSDHR
jgi:F-type H+-transporting ATPase subunit epsilon